MDFHWISHWGKSAKSSLDPSPSPLIIAKSAKLQSEKHGRPPAKAAPLPAAPQISGAAVARVALR